MQDCSHRFFVRSNGCMTLRNKTSRAASFLRQNGWTEALTISDADTVIITTCGVTFKTEGESYEMIEDVLRCAKPDTKIIVSGCLPKINKDGLKNAFPNRIIIEEEWRNIANLVPDATDAIEDAVVFGSAEHSTGDPLLKGLDLTDDIFLLNGFSALSRHLNDPWYEDAFRYSSRGFHFWREPQLHEVLIVDGCSYKCNFCATVLAIGHSKSRQIDQIKKETLAACDRGFKKIVLQGDELGFYGKDIGTNLKNLLEELVSLERAVRIGLRYVHPYALLRLEGWLDEFFRSDQLYFMCNAFQTGSQALAKKMNRSGDLWKAADRILAIKNQAPRSFFHSQFIVGFPGETEEDFRKTVELIEYIDFHYINIEKFSARPGTGAALLVDDVPEPVKMERQQILNSIHQQSRRRRLVKAASQGVNQIRIIDPVAESNDPLSYVRSLGQKLAHFS
jgi:tRNA A37 methylthiotransferase MiaB